MTATDHKWLAPKCDGEGCQSLILQGKIDDLQEQVNRLTPKSGTGNTLLEKLQLLATSDLPHDQRLQVLIHLTVELCRRTVPELIQCECGQALLSNWVACHMCGRKKP